jgi:hypothetical protein
LNQTRDPAMGDGKRSIPDVLVPVLRAAAERSMPDAPGSGAAETIGAQQGTPGVRHFLSLGEPGEPTCSDGLGRAPVRASPRSRYLGRPTKTIAAQGLDRWQDARDPRSLGTARSPRSLAAESSNARGRPGADNLHAYARGINPPCFFLT